MPNEIRYFDFSVLCTGGTFRYPNAKYNIGTNTDTAWMISNDFFDIFEFPAPTKNLHNIYMSDRGIRHHSTNNE